MGFSTLKEVGNPADKGSNKKKKCLSSYNWATKKKKTRGDFTVEPTLFQSINSTKFMIVQPVKVNMNKTTLLVLSRNSTRRTWRRQWSEWVWWRWNGRRTERTSATFTTSRTTSSSNTAGPELNLQQAASLLRKLFTSDKTRTVSSPPGIMIPACCCCLCSLLTVLLAAIGSHSHCPPWPGAVVVVPDARPQNQ